MNSFYEDFSSLVRATIKQQKSSLSEDDFGEEFVESETISEEIITKVNSKGERRRRVKCKKGFKLNQDGTACVPISGGDKQKKNLAIKKAVRTKNQAGQGAKNKANRLRAKANKRRKSMGL